MLREIRLLLPNRFNEFRVKGTRVSWVREQWCSRTSVVCV
jgi:hypothetical protein